MEDDGNDPVTRHEDERCAYSQKDDGNQQEEAGTHPATGTESSEEPGATRQPCAITSAPSSSKDVVDLQKQLESLESTLRTIPHLTFLVEDFGARIANMEAAQGKTERKPPTKTDSTRVGEPPTKTDSTRVGEVSRQDVDTLTENRSTAARQSQIRPSQAQVMDDHQRFVDEGDETPDEIPSEAPRRAPKNRSRIRIIRVNGAVAWNDTGNNPGPVRLMSHPPRMTITTKSTSRASKRSQPSVRASCRFIHDQWAHPTLGFDLSSPPTECSTSSCRTGLTG